MSSFPPYLPNPHCTLSVIVVGAGLGGLSAAIALSLAGHTVTILESTPTITEIGAGIQILPNASRILQSWGLEPHLLPFTTHPKCVNLRRWSTGAVLASLDFATAAKQWGAPFWDFHRADLQREMLRRTQDLQVNIRCGARVCRVLPDSGTAILKTGESLSADLIIAADGIFSSTRSCLSTRDTPPTPTGDLAYRILLDTATMADDPDLAPLLADPVVNYWIGPGKHAVNYPLKQGRLFNVVLLVPDDIPPDSQSTTVRGDVQEMRAQFEDWDPVIQKLLNLCHDVHKWKLCIRDVDEIPWSSRNGRFVLLGDAVHATLPYLASGAGMALEDGATIGEVLARIRSREELGFAAAVYERCRKERTRRVVERGNLQQYLYHIEDGEEQRERDRILALGEPPEGEALVWRDRGFAKWLFGGSIKADVEKAWQEEELGWMERERLGNRNEAVARS